MNRFFLALKAFFKTLGNAEFADQIRGLVAGSGVSQAAVSTPATPKAPAVAMPLRSDALTLLAALQREARLVDFLQEDLTSFSDGQIGAAVRDIQRDGQKALARMFALEPILDQPEGEMVDVPAGFDAAVYRVTGNVAGEPPYRGQLVHRGWQVTCCELPQWSGSDGGTKIIAAAEVELS